MAKPVGSTEAILLLGGAFNPIHNGHIQTLIGIKQYMESKHNYKIISGFCVISTDRYVYGKYKKSNSKAIPFKHRKALVELAAKDYSWIFPSDFECASAPMYGELIVHEKEYKKYFNKKNGNIVTKKQLKNIKRINCMGADKILTSEGIGIWTFIANLQSELTMNIAIGRDGYMNEVQRVYDEDVKNDKVDVEKFMLIDLKVNDISSTKIRGPLIKIYENMVNADELVDGFRNKMQSCLCNDVIEYLLDNINDLWIDDDYFENKKAISKKKSKSWFSGFGWNKK